MITGVKIYMSTSAMFGCIYSGSGTNPPGIPVRYYKTFFYHFLHFFCERDKTGTVVQMNMAASSSTTMPPSIPVIFSTKTPYQLPPQKFMIPASWRRFQLSQLINTALALPRVVPFDFLIRGVLLGGSLSEVSNGEVSLSRASSHDTGTCE